MSDSATFRSWLKRRRIERGLTQEELGELVGYAAQTIRKIEGGQRRPSLQLALKLAQALQLDAGEQAAWMSAARAVAEEEEKETFLPPSQDIRPPTPSPGLPSYLTPFIGREQAKAELEALLDRTDCRLITLLGPGGVGKTRLAVETGRVVRGFGDGIAFVSLASVAAPSLVVPAIGEALGFGFGSTGDLLTQLVNHLRERRVLLILDNLEQLLDAEGVTLGVLERLLQQAPHLVVLLTSRERLRLHGEWVVELEGLALAEGRSAANAGTGPALTLFAEHAERVDRTFRLTSANEPIVAAICRLVDGLPLGIELAATWTRLLPLDEIAQELGRGLDTSHLSPRTLPSRHHSLHAVVDHSWQLLNAQERAVLCRLSVFRGGFTREAAAQVADTGLGLLAALSDKSLLLRGANGRYDLHEVIRQFADARLREQADELRATREQHAAYYLRWVAEREQRLMSGEQVAVMTQLSAEIDNIRAAWGWAATQGMLNELECAAETLQWLYAFRCWSQEGTALFAQAVERLRPVGVGGDEAARRRTLGRILASYGYLATRLGTVAEAHKALVESYELLAEANDPRGLARTLLNQASIAYWSGKYNEAQRLLASSLALATTVGDRVARVGSLTWGSAVAQAIGEYEEAERLFRAALADYRQLGSPRGLIWCVNLCCTTLFARGNYQEAEQLLREALMASYATQDSYGTAKTLQNLGLATMQQGDTEAAIYFLREAVSMLQIVWSPGYAEALNDLAAALWQSGAIGEARRAYGEALRTALEVEAHQEIKRAIIGIASVAEHTGDHATALRFAAYALADGSNRDEARRIHQAARAHLSPAEVARIEQQVGTVPLAEAVGTHAALGVPRC
jgi:predicted ATPase/DNA-binding XRE family transcriptional regulator/Tfp pilus assembly protein PilF